MWLPMDVMVRREKTYFHSEVGRGRGKEKSLLLFVWVKVKLCNLIFHVFSRIRKHENYGLSKIYGTISEYTRYALNLLLTMSWYVTFLGICECVLFAIPTARKVWFPLCDKKRINSMLLYLILSKFASCIFTISSSILATFSFACHFSNTVWALKLNVFASSI